MSHSTRILPPSVASLIACLAIMGCLVSGQSHAQPAAVADPSFAIAGGSLSLAAPEGFERVRPKSMMVETEFSIHSEGDAPAGRMTVMGAGGSVEANIDRWAGQFSQPDGGDTKEKLATKKLEIAGCKVTIVDITGTFLDQPGGPFAGGPTVQRPDYRMLAAIVITPEAGNYFLKFYGPAATVGKHAAGFQAMLEGMVPTGAAAR
jgi:hypothetical protein